MPLAVPQVTPSLVPAVTARHTTRPAVPIIQAPSHSSFGWAGPSGSHGKPMVSKVQAAVMACCASPTFSVWLGGELSPTLQAIATEAPTTPKTTPRSQLMKPPRIESKGRNYEGTPDRGASSQALWPQMLNAVTYKVVTTARAEAD